MDIGCGTGEQLFQLAAALPSAQLTGVDVSAPNIEHARKRAKQLGLEIAFAAADYREFRTSPQDLIIAYSTLHLIPGDTRALFRKIGAELAPGGLLMNVMPYQCAYNTMLSGVRRLFAAIRSRATDALILAGARILHGRNTSDELLRERVAYMYQPLERLDGHSSRDLLAQCGLEFVSEAPEPHASLAQPKHRLSVFRKR